MDDMRAFLRKQPDGITEFDEKLVRRLVEKVIVREEGFSVEFKSGVMVGVTCTVETVMRPRDSLC